jgi:hypothetical protein
MRRPHVLGRDVILLREMGFEVFEFANAGQHMPLLFLDGFQA